MYSISSHYIEDERESLRKRMKPSNVDRITNLPDALITHILSLLPLNDAVKTQFLSKPWRFAWASTHIVTYSGTWLYPATKLISNALMLHKGPIKKLSLLEIGSSFDRPNPPIHLWVQCAVNKQIEVLVLELDPCVESYVLPDNLFLCDSLKEFSLSATKFDLGLSISWKSLKKLTLTWVRNLCFDKIHKIIKGSPELESLNLIYCAGFSRIIVPSSSKLRNLMIDSYDQKRFYDSDDEEEDDSEDDELLEISGHGIKSLVISGYMGDKHCELNNVCSLVQVSPRFCMAPNTFDDDYEEAYDTRSSGDVIYNKLRKYQRIMLHFIQKISHVEKLSLGNWCTQVLSMCELGYKPTVLLKCKSLEINSIYEESIPCIARLLRSSPCMERLTIYMECFHPDKDEILSYYAYFKGKDYWKSQKRAAFENPWEQLKVVQLIGFDKQETTLVAELAEYVLDNAKVLETLVAELTDGRI